MITLLILVAMDIANIAFHGAYITEIPYKESEWSYICVKGTDFDSFYYFSNGC
jgi:hypothetical protein